MLSHSSVDLHIKQITSSLEENIKKYHNSLRELKRLSIALFTQIKADTKEIEEWFRVEGFGLDEDGFWQSLPLLDDYRNNKIAKDSLAYSLNLEALKNIDGCFRMYSLRNLGPLLLEINKEIPSLELIYYQDRTNCAVIFPYLDQSTAVTSAFDWREYYTFKSVEPQNNPKGEIRWTNPSVDYAAGGLILSGSIPVELNNEFIGLWSIDVPMTALYSDILFNTILDGQVNYIIDHKGLIVVHPRVETRIDQEKGSIFRRSVHDVCPEFESIDIDDLLKKKSGRISIKKRISNEEIMVYFEKITGIDWIFISTFPSQSMEDVINKKIMEALNHVSSGDFSFRLKNTFAIEEAELIADSFNKMASALENKEKIRKKAQDEKEKLEQRLQHFQRMDAIGTLAGGIAHDFNNIISPILGYSEFLVEDLTKDTPEYNMVSQIFKASLRARDLVKQILTFSRQTELSTQTVKIQDVIDEALLLIRASIPTDIKIIKNVDYDCPRVYGDPTKLHQVIVNLCTNAFHAVEKKDGILEVSLDKISLEKENEINFGDIKPGLYARLSVSDNGHGIDNNTLKKIFDPYFTTKKNQKGTGLGLSVSYGIIQKLGGYIKVYSEVGKGSCFQVFIPFSDIKLDEKCRIKSKAVKGSGKILFLDDEEDIAVMSKNILTKYGYNVTIFTKSLDAFDFFQKNSNSFDLIITDMAMPDMNGREFVKKVKEIRPNIPIILCTGFSEKLYMKDNQEITIDEFLMKPITNKRLLSTIKEVLDKNLNNKS